MSASASEPVPVSPCQKHYCYVLVLVGDDRVTYVGYTVNIHRRLRQHNGELCGGARFTTRLGPAQGRRWRVLLLVTCQGLDHHRGLSLEWHMRNPGGRRRKTRGRTGDQTPQKRGAEGRVVGLAKAMAHRKFADDTFVAWIVPEFRAAITQAVTDASVRCTVRLWLEPGVDGNGDGDMDMDTDSNNDLHVDMDME